MKFTKLDTCLTNSQVHELDKGKETHLSKAQHKEKHKQFKTMKHIYLYIFFNQEFCSIKNSSVKEKYKNACSLCQNASTLRLEYKSSDCPSCQDITVGMKEGLQHIAHYGTGQSE